MTDQTTPARKTRQSRATRSAAASAAATVTPIDRGATATGRTTTGDNGHGHKVTPAAAPATTPATTPAVRPFFPVIKVKGQVVGSCQHGGHEDKKSGQVCGKDLVAAAGTSVNHLFYRKP